MDAAIAPSPMPPLKSEICLLARRPLLLTRTEKAEKFSVGASRSERATCKHASASMPLFSWALCPQVAYVSTKRLLWRASVSKYSTCAQAAESDETAGSSNEDQEGPDPEDFDSGWLPAFPHALTAAMANFMFGYHIGIVNGPLTSIARDLSFEGNTIMEGLVVSIFLVGAFFGSISGGILADKIGRKRTFQVDMLPLIFGSALSASTDSVHGMILGRFLVGIGIGVNAGLVPLYISEVAPTKYRGALGSICQIGTCIGIITALVLGIPSESDPHWWRVMFWIAIIPGFLLILGMQFAVESPRWLSKVGRWEEACSTISKLWGGSQVQRALQDLRKANDADDASMEASWLELLSERYYKAPAIGGILFALQQFAGINGVLYFSSLTFRDAGITNSMVASAAMGVSNLFGSLSALYLMDRQGRRILLMGSYLGMAMSMAIVVFALEGHLDESVSHALSIIGTLTYVYTFALGAGPVTALIIPELSSTRIRAKTVAVSLCVHWVCNFVIGLFFLELVKQFGLPAIYISFGIVSLLSIVFVNIFIIETKGRSLEEMELLMNPNFVTKD